MKTGSVELVQLRKEFGDVTAVDGIDVSIEAGEFFSLLGPSGCGKTTSLRLIAGFERPTAGKILLDGSDMAATPPHRRKVNTVFQSYALFPHLDVFDNVAFGLRRARVKKAEIRERVTRVLEAVQLGEYGKRKPSQLSGGQQQRVALARALVLEPSVLLLDEPLGALDAKLRKALQLELKSIQERFGITFVYVTHDQEEALTMSDRIAVMSGGRVEQIATPEAMYEEPRDRLRRRLPRRLEPHGRDGDRHRGRRLPDAARRLLPARLRGRDRPAGRDACRDPAGARRDRAVRGVGRRTACRG